MILGYVAYSVICDKDPKRVGAARGLSGDAYKRHSRRFSRVSLVMSSRHSCPLASKDRHARPWPDTGDIRDTVCSTRPEDTSDSYLFHPGDASERLPFHEYGVFETEHDHGPERTEYAQRDHHNEPSHPAHCQAQACPSHGEWPNGDMASAFAEGSIALYTKDCLETAVLPWVQAAQSGRLHLDDQTVGHLYASLSSFPSIDQASHTVPDLLDWMRGQQGVGLSSTVSTILGRTLPEQTDFEYMGQALLAVADRGQGLDLDNPQEARQVLTIFEPLMDRPVHEEP